MNKLFVIISKIFYHIYGYEAINVIFKISPSQATISVLKTFGAKIGDRVTIQTPLTIHAAESKPIYKNLVIGDQVYIGRNCLLDLSDAISIADRVTISHSVIINTHTNIGASGINKEIIKNSLQAVSISNDTFIGINSVILGGVEIGSNSFVGASSLVNNSIPEKVVAVGNPCKIIKKI